MHFVPLPCLLKVFEQTVDPDQMPQNMASDQGLPVCHQSRSL